MKSGSLDPDEKRILPNDALRGWEIVDATARLCAMNLLLHGISAPESPSLVTVDDSLRSTPSEHFDMVLTNPPFGRKSSYKVVNAQGETEREEMSYLREDFWATTSNKQLNFLQHVRSLLTINGRAAIVVPDNVLFEGGAGETVRRRLLEQCDVHTLLRLPTRIFYAGGVKANVLFFDRKPPSERPWTDKLWIYDFRTNQNFTLKTRALVRADLDDFVACYNPGNRHERTETERFRPFTYDELVARDKASLDIFWLRDESLEDTGNLPAPELIAAEIVEDLQAALDQFAAIAASLGAADTKTGLSGKWRLGDVVLSARLGGVPVPVSPAARDGRRVIRLPNEDRLHYRRSRLQRGVFGQRQHREGGQRTGGSGNGVLLYPAGGQHNGCRCPGR
jgi:type I restriction enzyme M protein